MDHRFLQTGGKRVAAEVAERTAIRLDVCLPFYRPCGGRQAGYWIMDAGSLARHAWA
jgi:hypothetical protein